MFVHTCNHCPEILDQLGRSVQLCLDCVDEHIKLAPVTEHDVNIGEDLEHVLDVGDVLTDVLPTQVKHKSDLVLLSKQGELHRSLKAVREEVSLHIDGLGPAEAGLVGLEVAHLVLVGGPEVGAERPLLVPGVNILQIKPRKNILF